MLVQQALAMDIHKDAPGQSDTPQGVLRLNSLRRARGSRQNDGDQGYERVGHGTKVEEVTLLGNVTAVGGELQQKAVPFRS